MPPVPIIMPQLGESIAEATIVRFLVEPGATVQADQELIEVETNKATSQVTSPCAGVLTRWSASIEESYPVGATLGLVEASAADAARLGAPASPAADLDSSRRPGGGGQQTYGSTRPHPERVVPTVRGLPVPANAVGAGYMSPRMKARMAELGLHAADLAGLPGTGAGGRVTVEDFEKFLANLEKHQLSEASSMRIAVADAMRRSWTRPLATVALPVRIDALLAHRRGLHLRPGPALYALRALALALAENSAVAGRLVGNKIVHPASIDIGVAVEAEDGVLVPVLRGADRRPLAGLVEPYQTLVEQARARRLPPEACGPSAATVTNFGTFGLTWATPIPLPEQTLVLGMGAGRKVPNWDEAGGRFLPVTEANMTLSFDHRVLDGGAAGRLLARIAALLAEPGKL